MLSHPNLVPEIGRYVCLLVSRVPALIEKIPFSSCGDGRGVNTFKCPNTIQGMAFSRPHNITSSNLSAGLETSAIPVQSHSSPYNSMGCPNTKSRIVGQTIGCVLKSSHNGRSTSDESPQLQDELHSSSPAHSAPTII